MIVTGDLKAAVKKIAALTSALAILIGLVVTVSSTTVAAASPSPIVIGATVDATGAEAATGGFQYGVDAWAKWTNAHGGILGRQIKLITIDTKSDPTTQLVSAETLVNADHVAALVPGSYAGSTISQFILSSKFPAVGGFGDDLTWFTNPYFFPAFTTPDQIAGSLVSMPVKAGATKVGFIYCAEAVTCSESVPLIQNGAAKDHGSLVYTAEISATAPSYAANCLAAQSAGAKAIIPLIATPTVIQVAQQCASNSYKPLYSTSAQTLSTAELATPQLNGALVSFYDLPYSVKSAALANYSAAMHKYYKSFLSSPLYGQNTLQGWISGLLVTAAITAANPGAGAKVTSATVLKGLYKLHGTTLGGLAPPLSYVPGKPTSIPCFYEAKFVNTHLSLTTPKALCPS